MPLGTRSTGLVYYCLFKKVEASMETSTISTNTSNTSIEGDRDFHEKVQASMKEVEVYSEVMELEAITTSAESSTSMGAGSIHGSY